MLNKAVSHGEMKDEVLFCLAHCKAGVYFWLSHRVPVQSLGKTINMYVERGQTKATSYFLLFHGLNWILLFLVFQTGRKILKCPCWKKIGPFLPWLQTLLWIAVKQMSSLKKFQCNLDHQMRQLIVFIPHLFNPLFQGALLWILYSQLELFFNSTPLYVAALSFCSLFACFCCLTPCFSTI